ncbi:glycosyl hydrolases family 16-domain-containing protein [Umbelopsis sp. AD052]|nr:glycosyl hydrolases family 16-domain-containing protein [Umbelopsis sp. AD052]
MFALLSILAIVQWVAASSCPQLDLDFSKIADGTSPFDVGFNDVWCGQNTHIQGGKLDLSLNQNCGPDIATDLNTQSGLFEVDMETSWGSGVVTAITLFSAGTSADKRDEVDMEFIGTDVTTVETTYFVDGAHVPGATQSVDFHVASNTSSSRHTYGMEYTPDHIAWYIDGRKVKTVLKENGVAFPSKPVSLHLSLWDGTEFSEWAGKINWNAAPGQTYHASVYSVKITQNSCSGSVEKASNPESVVAPTPALAVYSTTISDVQSVSSSASPKAQATMQAVSSNVDITPSSATAATVSAPSSASSSATVSVTSTPSSSATSTPSSSATSSAASYAWHFTYTIAAVALVIFNNVL